MTLPDSDSNPFPAAQSQIDSYLNKAKTELGFGSLWLSAIAVNVAIILEGRRELFEGSQPQAGFIGLIAIGAIGAVKSVFEAINEFANSSYHHSLARSLQSEVDKQTLINPFL